MSTTDVRSGEATEMGSAGVGDIKLEVVVIPASDADRAKRSTSRRAQKGRRGKRSAGRACRPRPREAAAPPGTPLWAGGGGTRRQGE